MTTDNEKGNDADVFTLHPSDGSFTIKTRKISLKQKEEGRTN